MAKILVVDDQSVVRLVMAEFTESLGYEYEEASTVNEAIQKLSNGTYYDAVFSDICLSDPADERFTAYKIIEFLQEQQKYIPFITTSGNEKYNPDIPESCVPSSVISYIKYHIQKPIQLSALEIALKKVLEVKQ